MTATQFLGFVRSGSRAVFEQPFFYRRRKLIVAMLHCCITGQLDEVIDGLWCICEETSWVIIAHNVNAIPYGRSMTYRFAQSCFWSALALADAKPEGMAWGEIKHLLLSNIRSWMQLPIFDRGGVLTVGYVYPNLCISEGYIAPVSPSAPHFCG